jgi:2',3'-cyclic-nucleotide 2'-phosphodiesterase (5'-nucleotidase family)
MTTHFLYIIVGASLMACSARFKPTFEFNELTVQEMNNTKEPGTDHYQIKDFLKPFQDTLHQEFDAIIATTSTALFVKRPGSNLMNWCADAVLSNLTANKRFNEPVICLLNTGGLRSSFGIGKLTLRDFYQLMPFDNTITWVHLPVDRIADIARYLQTSGGEPIANCVYRQGQLEIPNLLPSHQYIWVLTSDFLANGGDQMRFFLGLEKQETNILLRDVLIAQAKNQGELVLDTFIRCIP